MSPNIIQKQHIIFGNFYSLKTAGIHFEYISIEKRHKKALIKMPVELNEIKKIVREGGLEPPNRKAPDPKSGASANSATRAKKWKSLFKLCY